MAETNTELRWTADAQSATEASWVCWPLSATAQLARSCMFFFVGFTAINVVPRRVADPSYVVGAGVVQAFVVTLVFGVALAGCTYVKLVRSLKQYLGAGTELTATWGSDFVVYRDSLAETRLALDTIETVRVFQYWVAFRQTGSRGWRLWPRELFPAHVLARFQEPRTV